MKLPPILKFTLGILRRPHEAIGRIRELRRIARAPGTGSQIRAEAPVKVMIIPVDPAGEQAEQVIDIYARNPSPFVVGPKTMAAFREDTEKGIRYFLIGNEDGDIIGIRAFDPNSKMLIGTVTEFDHRSHGYQLFAGRALREHLAAEGVDEFRAVVFKKNSRIQRAMLAEGWTLEPHPTKPDMLRGSIRAKREP